MARPERHDADYFPFYVKDGKTLFILESKYGLQGIGFFTNVMRFLTRQTDHHICIADESDRLYFFAQIRCPEDSGIDMLNLMAKTGKIDSGLWEKNRVIVSQDLLNSLKEAYKNRNNTIIEMSKIRVSYQHNPISYPQNPVTSPDNPQRKGKERKGKESISKKAKIPLPENFQISPAVYQWAKNKGHTRLDEHLESFKAKCRANGYQYIDWDSAFMEAVRSDWAKLKPAGGNGNGGIRTARSDPRDKTLQSREDAEIAAIIAKREAAKQSARDHTGGNAATDDAPDFSNAGLTE
jgi:hypothetical protein